LYSGLLEPVVVVLGSGLEHTLGLGHGVENAEKGGME
jgi:hypothetical protein